MYVCLCVSVLSNWVNTAREKEEEKSKLTRFKSRYTFPKENYWRVSSYLWTLEENISEVKLCKVHVRCKGKIERVAEHASFLSDDTKILERYTSEKKRLEVHTFKMLLKSTMGLFIYYYYYYRESVSQQAAIQVLYRCGTGSRFKDQIRGLTFSKTKKASKS